MNTVICIRPSYDDYEDNHYCDGGMWLVPDGRDYKKDLEEFDHTERKKVSLVNGGKPYKGLIYKFLLDKGYTHLNQINIYH